MANRKFSPTSFFNVVGDVAQPQYFQLDMSSMVSQNAGFGNPIQAMFNTIFQPGEQNAVWTTLLVNSTGLLIS